MLTNKKRVGDGGVFLPRSELAASLPARCRMIVLLQGVKILCGAAVLLFAAGCTPPGPKALLQGEKLIKEGHYQDAIARLEAATQLLPENAQAWNHYGLACHLGGQPEKAAAAYLQALNRDRNLFVVYYNIGNLYFETGNWAAAADAFTRYTVSNPQPYEPWLMLGLAQFRSRQIDAAERSLQQALARNRRLPDALNVLGMIESQRRRYRDAYNYFNSALNVQPNFPPALLNAAITAHLHLTQRPFALQAYRAYLALQPTPANAEAVRLVAQQLEWELNPQLRPAVTNLARLAGVVSNTIPAAQTSAPVTQQAAVVTPPPTNRPAPAPVVTAPVTNIPPPRTTNTAVAASRPATNTVPATNKVVQAPAPAAPERTSPPPEEAPVTKVLVATNDTAPPVAKPPVTTNTGPERSPVAAPVTRPSEPVVQETVPPAIPATPDAEEKSGLLSRLNPKNWFSSKEKPPTPLPGKNGEKTPAKTVAANTTTPTNKPPVTEAAPAPKQVETKPAPPPPPPRYVYQHPPKPVAGDRKAAERLFVQAYEAHKIGQYAAAIPAYRAAAAADPTYFDVLHNLCLVALQGGDLPQALIAGEQALAVDPDSASARYNFALALQRAGFNLDAANELETLLAAHPKENNARLLLGNIYAQQLQQVDDARRHYLQLLENDPRNPQAASIRNWLATHP